MATSRNQPSYDFLTGGSSPPGKRPLQRRESSANRRPLVVRPDSANEELRAQVNKLQYELDSLKQDREVIALRHEQETRQLQIRIESESSRAETLGSAKGATTSKVQALARELQECQDRAANQTLDLEKRLRVAQAESRRNLEEAEEARSSFSSLERHHDRQVKETETRHASLVDSIKELKAEVDAKSAALQESQQRLLKQEANESRQEAEILRLRAQAGDVDALAVVKRELTEQVAHIRKLELSNRDQLAELKQLRKQRKNVEVVEEEKRALESKLRLMDELRNDLNDAKLRKQILEDEREGWASYLESDAAQTAELQFDSAEQMARAFIQERAERAALLKQVGALQPELDVRDANIRALEDEMAQLKLALDRARAKPEATAVAGDSKLRVRLERQRALAVKEVEYLRAQLKMFESDEAGVDDGGQIDGAQRDQQRVRELESLVESYRSELQSSNTEHSRLEQELTTAAAAAASSSTEPATPTTVTNAKKRPRTDAGDADDGEPDHADGGADARTGTLLRRNRRLQDELAAATTRGSVLETETAALRKRVDALQATGRTRVLALRRNPTADAEAVKLDTLRVLRDENAALRALLPPTAPTPGPSSSGINTTISNSISTTTATTSSPSPCSLTSSSSSSVKLVPAASLEVLRDELAARDRELAARDKRTLRLREQWAALADDFRDVAASLLGWRLEFLDGGRRGRVRVSSVFRPTRAGAGADDDEGDDDACSIVFDSRLGTMKLSGGRDSAFAGLIREITDEWVDRRNVIPCFLAAVTLDFWERREAERVA